ncbi:hypothetical protein LIER_41291 [Lithospermum erythrorhizon]|uniref:Uncharacterized protein n=1 Tax=Lithospermum erythrorhizon TaxID=34254 RepID=A0AAV3RAP0_LITER
MTMRSGIFLDTGAHGDKKAEKDGHKIDNQREAIHEKEHIEEVLKTYVPPVPFPKTLLRSKMDKSFFEIYDMLSTVHVNLPLLNVLKNIAAYATLIKELIVDELSTDTPGADVANNEDELNLIHAPVSCCTATKQKEEV